MGDHFLEKRQRTKIAVRTDHDAISLELGKLEGELKGPGNWKMNCSLLKPSSTK